MMRGTPVGMVMLNDEANAAVLNEWAAVIRSTLPCRRRAAELLPDSAEAVTAAGTCDGPIAAVAALAGLP